MKSCLNKLPEYFVPDFELVLKILDTYDSDNVYQWRKQAIEMMRSGVSGHMSKKKASLHVEHIEVYLLPKKEILKQIVEESRVNQDKSI